MMRIKYGLVILWVGSLVGWSCQNNPQKESEATQQVATGDNSQNALDWDGIYVADLPCADCPGIRSVLVLQNDHTYEMRWVYQERGDSVFVERGTFEWKNNGSTIQLSEGSKQAFQVGENQLFQLDGDGKRIEGELASHFIFHKKEIGFKDTPWRLVQVDNTLKSDYPISQDPYIEFLDERIVGTGGCNRISGTYTLADSNKIHFGPIISTRMACPEMQLEFLVLQAFERTKSFEIKDQQLIFKDENGESIMRFEADFLIGEN